MKARNYYFTLVKPTIDFLFALVLIIVLSPLFLVIFVIIKLNSKGEVFFRQARIGQMLKPFQIYKFRTMSIGAQKSGGSTLENDARITSVGKYLRKLSLDELPQIINIVKGEMSFIGPRPDLEEHLSLFTKEHLAIRSRVKPGITGLSQTKGRSSISLEDRIRYDEEYANSVTFINDAKIFFATIVIVLNRGGSN